MEVVVDVPETVIDNGVNDLAVSEAQTRASAKERRVTLRNEKRHKVIDAEYRASR